MSNSILHIELHDHRLIPAEAEVRLRVVPAIVDRGTEVRGRLMGPCCRFASTIEVAYHFRPLPAQTGQGLTLRAIIPEASFWEPQSPHLYAGPVELWQDGQRCQTVQVRHGLRHLSLGPRGLRVNGRLLRLRGRAVESLDDEQALALRQTGFNLVVVPVREATRSAWEVADRIGLFVLGRLAGYPALLGELARHPSCLGWLSATAVPAEMVPPGTFLGGAVPGAAFEVLRPGEAATHPDRPVLLVDAPAGADSESAVLGVVER